MNNFACETIEPSLIFKMLDNSIIAQKVATAFTQPVNFTVDTNVIDEGISICLSILSGAKAKKENFSSFICHEEDYLNFTVASHQGINRSSNSFNNEEETLIYITKIKDDLLLAKECKEILDESCIESIKSFFKTISINFRKNAKYGMLDE